MYWRLLIGLSLCYLSAGCSMKPTWPDPNLQAALAAGASQAIEWRIEDGPVDETLDASDRLTLASALELNLRNDPRIQAALAEVHIAYADAQQARLLPNPVLSIVLKYPETGGSPAIEGGVAADLLSILQTPGRARAADHRLRAASANSVQTVLDVVSDLQETYAAVQAFDQRLPLLQQRLARIERLHKIAQARLNAGEASRVEVVTFAAERAAVEADLDELLLERREHRLRLARLIGQPGAAADWRVDAWREPSHRSVSERPWIAAALRRRPELQRIEWELAALGEDVKLSQLALLEGTEVGAEGEREEGDWSTGPAISAPIPIFDWGQAKKAGKTAAIIQARHALTQAQREVVEQVRRACAVFNESVHELRRAREQLLPLQQQRRDLVEAAYRAGQTDVTAVILADQDLADARSKEVALEQRVTTSLIALHRAVGGQGVAANLVEQTPDAISPEVLPIEQPDHAYTTDTQP